MADDPLLDATCDRDPIELLAAEFVERRRGGGFPTVESYAQEYPELADAIRELFPTIVRLERLKRDREHSSCALATAGLPRAARLGGFQIIREIGRGGMGIVYEAEDRVLKRRVALKVLGANVAGSAAQLRRFHHEAQSAARLHHTNIVPVFGTGEEHGVLFYVMQFIDGLSLAEVIEWLSRSHAPLSRFQAPLGNGPAEAPLRRLPQDVARVASETTSEAEVRKWRSQVELGNESDADSPGAHSPCLPLPLSPPLATRANPALNRAAARPGIPAAPGEHGWRHWKTTVGTGIRLADALACAHAQGVLHRDVKPANVLIDREGRVWIVDFGLAKHVENPALTATGDLIGTLRYMAPEQFRGEADARSDVYSLGLTLYELLVLRPAFAETHHAELVKQKTTASLPPLRSTCPDVPHDLETILFKACALEPAHRYQSAADLADDLRRLAEDRPIQARRVSPVERAWRWSRRNRMTAGLMGLAAVLLVAVAVTLIAGNRRTNVALKQAVEAADAARAERRRAEANLDIAVRAMHEIMEGISERGVPQTLPIGGERDAAALQHATVSEADAALLRSLLGFFDEFAAKNGANLNSQTAVAWRQIGEIQQRLGKLTEAEAAFGQSVEVYGTLITASPADSQLVVELSGLWNRIGNVRSQRGDVPAAFQAHARARELLESSATAGRTEAGKFVLAETLILLGTVGSQAGGAEMAPEMFGAFAREGGRPGFDFANRPPPPPPIERDEALFRAEAILKELLERDPENASWQFALAKTHRSQLRLGPPRRFAPVADPQSAADQATRILRGLVARFPASPMYAYELASTLGRAAQRVPDFHPAEREGLLREALPLARQLASTYPQVPEYQALVGSTERRLGALVLARGDLAEARQRYRDALELHEKLTAQFPAVSMYQVGYAQTLSEWAQAQRAAGQSDAARQTMASAVAIAERTAEAWPLDPLFRDFLAHLHRRQRELEAM